MAETALACIVFIMSIGAFIISFRAFKEKGFLFNNAYIYASKQERSNMNKKPYYRQSAIVFLFVGIIFLLNALDIILKTGWIFYVVLAVAIITIIYAFTSSVSIEKNPLK